MSPARSTSMTIVNKTSSDLILTDFSCSHGVWSEGMSPPQVIAPNESGSFQAESDGIMTGDEGHVTYQVGSGATLTLRFDNPFSGSNSYSETAPPGYSISRSGGDGDNASVTWTIYQN